VNPSAAVASLLLVLLVASLALAVEPADLRCEYLVDPLGLDTARPRLSWAMADPDHTRGQRQTAWQVLAASSPERLAADTGDLWDSGRVASDQSVGVDYGGTALASGESCWWKVRLWDKDGAPTAWSAPARFSVGLLAAADWQAQWIGMASASEQECPWLRREFELDQVPETALAYVGSIGFHELYVNGRRVGDAVLTPSVSDLRQRALYLTYDLKPYLRPGRNAIALWLGPGWAQFSDANPPVGFGVVKKPLGIVQLQLGPAGGPWTRIVSDQHWRCAVSTTRHRGRWQNSDFGGDSVDAGRDVAGWNDVGCDDRAWEAATVYQPGRALSPDVIEPNRRCERIAAQTVAPAGPHKWRVTMSRLFAGWVEVKLAGAPGAKVTIKVSSLADHEVEYNQLDEYVVGASGQGVFCNRFSYHECQFVTIEGLPQAPAPDDVVGWRVSNDRPRIGDFDCSHPLLKRIYDVTVNTYLNLSTGGMTVDCPHRERLGYGGDGHTSLEIALDTFASDGFFAKWARDWCDVQRPDGGIYHTAPTMGGGGGPGWSGFILTMPWEVYQAYGDRRILEQVYPSGRRWLDFLQAHVGADGLLAPLPGGYWLFLGDWLTPHGSEGSDQPAALLFNNCYYLYATRLAAKIAHVLGRAADEAVYAERAAALAAAINKRFADPATMAYLDTRQTHCVMPLVAEAVPPEHVDQVVANLEHEILVARHGHLDTGLHGTYFMTRWLCEHDRGDLVYTYATQTTAPSYGDLLAKGYETWPEAWGGAPSRLHGCLNGIGGWFLRGLAGIRPDPSAPGYRHFLVEPQVVGDLTWVKAHHDGPYGRIEVAWRRDGRRFSLDLTVPANSAATVWLPAADPGAVTVPPGCRPGPPRAGRVTFEVEAGVWHFESALSDEPARH
jgi:hypothetical protein